MGKHLDFHACELLNQGSCNHRASAPTPDVDVIVSARGISTHPGETHQSTSTWGKTRVGEGSQGTRSKEFADWKEWKNNNSVDRASHSSRRSTHSTLDGPGGGAGQYVAINVSTQISRAEDKPQRIVAQRLLSRVQYHALLSRLQRI